MSQDAPVTLLTDPMSVLAFQAAVLAIIFWASGLPRLQKLFRYTPPVIYNRSASRWRRSPLASAVSRRWRDRLTRVSRHLRDTALASFDPTSHGRV